MFEDAGLKDKIIVVTGGSRGIGRHIVELLAKQGAKLYFFYHRSKALAQEVVDQAVGEGLHVKALQVDVRNKEQCEQAIEEIYEEHGRIDVLVNNSGIVRDNLLAGMDPQEFKDVIDTNIYGVFHATQVVVPFMMRQRAGKIINISSVSAEKGGRGQANYAASKGAINAMTKSLAVELAPRNILVNAVAPGVIETEMSQDVRDLGGDETLSKILLKRYGKPQDVAVAVGFLASQYANYITGEVLHVDGGFKMA